jgi:hypothetical protein
VLVILIRVFILKDLLLSLQFAANTLDYKISLRGVEEKSDAYYDARDKVQSFSNLHYVGCIE